MSIPTARRAWGRGTKCLHTGVKYSVTANLVNGQIALRMYLFIIRPGVPNLKQQ